VTTPIELPRPPDPPRLLEPAAVVEPPLRDMPAPSTPEITDWEVVRTARDTAPSNAPLLGRAMDIAMRDERAGSLLQGERVVVLGVARLLDRKSEAPATVLVAYDYERARSIEIELSGGDEAMRVAEVVESDHQPSPSDEEIDRAVRIARERVGNLLEPDWTVNALLTSSVSAGDRHFGQRMIVVVFGPADERLPRVRCLVDLGRDEAVGLHVRAVTGVE
jgi:hypothetical protein